MTPAQQRQAQGSRDSSNASNGGQSRRTVHAKGNAGGRRPNKSLAPTNAASPRQEKLPGKPLPENTTVNGFDVPELEARATDGSDNKASGHVLDAGGQTGPRSATPWAAKRKIQRMIYSSFRTLMQKIQRAPWLMAKTSGLNYANKSMHYSKQVELLKEVEMVTIMLLGLSRTDKLRSKTSTVARQNTMTRIVSQI